MRIVQYRFLANGMDSSSPYAAEQRERRQCARMVDVSQSFNNEEKPEMKITRIGVDIAKTVFHVHGIDRHGRVQWQASSSASSGLQL